MLKEIRKFGLEKYAGDQKLADEFVNGFIKAAFDITKFNEGIGSAIDKGIGATAIGMGIAGLGMAMKNVEMGALHTQFLTSLEHAIAVNPVLKQADPKRVVDYAETIFKFAPNVSTDANLLSSILANAIHGDGIDPMTIRTLADLESRYSDNKGSTFSPKTYV